MKTGKKKATARTAAQVKAQAQTQTLAQIIAQAGENAKLAFPNANGRVERGIAIAQDSRNVRIASDYITFYVHSQNGGGWYTVTETGCECRDHQYNGGQPCKHTIARWLVMKMQIATGARRTPLATARWEAEHPQECGCFLPSQTCPTCDAAAKKVYGEVL